MVNAILEIDRQRTASGRRGSWHPRLGGHSRRLHCNPARTPGRPLSEHRVLVGHERYWYLRNLDFVSMPVKPTAPKHKTEILGDRLTISVPSPRPWVLSIFVGLGVVFFIISGVIILGGLVTNSDGFEGPIFLLVILIIFWTVAGGLMIYQFAWQISGKEVIEITTQSIIISRVVLSL